jgi:hypothetical protein
MAGENAPSGNEVIVAYACVGEYAVANFAVQDGAYSDYLTYWFNNGPNWSSHSVADGPDSDSAGIPVNVIQELNNAVPVYNIPVQD